MTDTQTIALVGAAVAVGHGFRLVSVAAAKAIGKLGANLGPRLGAVERFYGERLARIEGHLRLEPLPPPPDPSGEVQSKP